jgi:hypothetical protein
MDILTVYGSVYESILVSIMVLTILFGFESSYYYIMWMKSIRAANNKSNQHIYRLVSGVFLTNLSVIVMSIIQVIQVLDIIPDTPFYITLPTTVFCTTTLFLLSTLFQLSGMLHVRLSVRRLGSSYF